MALQETQSQINIYNFFQKAVYATVALDVGILLFANANVPVASNLLQSFAKMGAFFPPLNAKFSTLVLIALVAIGTRAKKNKDLNVVNSIVIPIIIGLCMMFGSLALTDKVQNFADPNLKIWQGAYAFLSFIGAMITQMGADSISKLMQTKMGKDRWNTDWKEITGKKLTAKNVEDLLQKKKTGLIKGFKSKAGKSFDAYLTLNNELKIGFEFPARKK